ncbi:MAG: hypothetical protein JRH20_20630 [Deltaproteobacteria bacterium]|nr:hypothetical protein [Deltaproteobacteria bacterium]
MRFLWALPILFICSCNTPQIPLPPPSWDSFSVTVDTEAEEIRVVGFVSLAGGQLSIIDPISGNGIIRRIEETGAFDTGFFSAQDGQRFDVSYTDGHDSSDPACGQVSYSPPSLQKCPN